MLTIAVFLPLLSLCALWLVSADRPDRLRAVALAGSLLTLAVWIGLWLGFQPGQGYQYVQDLPWIESLGVGYRLGVDGLALPLLLLTALLFACAICFSADVGRRARAYYGWFLFLETACLGVFAAMDLFLFYVFWDLTLVGMYFIIAIWGHENAKASALTFFLYTLAGSVALLLGIIVIYLAMTPHTTDMAAIAAAPPLAAGGAAAQVAFFALLLGFAVKTPLVPVHTWLPPAHADAPAPGSAILAGVLLKMGTYGFLRILLAMLPQTFAQHAWLVVTLGVISVIYGALVALAQQDLKRLIAYTSIIHMGYVVMAVGAVGVFTPGDEAAAQLAANGAVLQMVSHGLIAAALFLLSGVIWTRAQTFEIRHFGGLAAVTPVYAGAFTLTAFAALGLPGLSGFVAEFQIFVGTFQMYPLAAAIALIGIVLTAALMLWTMQRLFFGTTVTLWQRAPDLHRHESLAIGPLLFFIVAIGLLPGWILTPINGYSTLLIALLRG